MKVLSNDLRVGKEVRMRKCILTLAVTSLLLVAVPKTASALMTGGQFERAGPGNISSSHPALLLDNTDVFSTLDVANLDDHDTFVAVTAMMQRRRFEESSLHQSLMPMRSPPLDKVLKSKEGFPDKAPLNGSETASLDGSALPSTETPRFLGLNIIFEMDVALVEPPLRQPSLEQGMLQALIHEPLMKNLALFLWEVPQVAIEFLFGPQNVAIVKDSEVTTRKILMDTAFLMGNQSPIMNSATFESNTMHRGSSTRLTPNVAVVEGDELSRLLGESHLSSIVQANITSIPTSRSTARLEHGVTVSRGVHLSLIYTGATNSGVNVWTTPNVVFIHASHILMAIA